jgi:VanZ family protein
MYAGRDSLASRSLAAARPGPTATGFTAAIAALRDRLGAVWPMVAAMWVGAFFGLLYLYVSPEMAPPTLKIEGVAHFDFDKLYHLLSHAGLLAVPIAVVPNRHVAWTMGALAIAAAFCFEFAQFWIPTRSFDLDDMAANMAGLVVGAISGRIVREL